MMKKNLYIILAIFFLSMSTYSGFVQAGSVHTKNGSATQKITHTKASIMEITKELITENTSKDNMQLAESKYNPQLASVRHSSSNANFRIVFDLPQGTVSKVIAGDNGTIIVDFNIPFSDILAQGIGFKDPVVSNISFKATPQGSQAIIHTHNSAGFKFGYLHNPERLFIDINKIYDYTITDDIAPGMTQIRYYSNKSGYPQVLTAVEYDPQKYLMKPILGGISQLGKSRLSAIMRDSGALVGVNASYFGSGREIYGVTKIDGELASSFYLPRTAVGVMPDGSYHFGTISYSGRVISDNGTVYLAGINAPRGVNSPIVYNHFYGDTTRTDLSGVEYSVENGIVTAIFPGNSPITKGSMVVSLPESYKTALGDIKVGDHLQIVQDLNSPWGEAQQILGVGPRLIHNGAVAVTASEENFGGDVTGGRAPRTALGLLNNGHILLAVLDGRQANAKGMYLEEFARLLRDMGVVDAINFDGGGSSEIVVKGRIINSPSDGGERYIATAAGVFSRQ